MKKSHNLLLLKVLFGLVHLLVFGFVLFIYLSSPTDLTGTVALLGLVVVDAMFMQYIIRKDERELADDIG